LPAGTGTPISEETAPPEEPTFPLTVTDQAGRNVTITAEPQKIISLAPSNTEIIYALGLEDRLVGVTTYCDYPEEALNKPKIGDIINPDIEKILTIRPDLILALETAHLKEITPRLEGLGLTVLTLEPQSLEEVLEAITLLGKCTGKDAEASQLVSSMRTRINAVTGKTANLPEAQKPRVLYMMWHRPVFVVAGGSLQDELIKLAGGINVAQGWGDKVAMVGLEPIIGANPQIILADLGMGIGDLILQFARTEPTLAGVDARINGRVYGANTKLTGIPGPRIVDGLELMAGLFYPQLFPEFFAKYGS